MKCYSLQSTLVNGILSLKTTWALPIQSRYYRKNFKKEKEKEKTKQP